MFAYRETVTTVDEPQLAPRDVGQASGWVSRLDRVNRARFAQLTLLWFLLCGMAPFGVMWPGDPYRNLGGDAVQGAWFLGWIPWAIAHGHSPFFTSWMYYPTGMNLAAQTSLPLLALLGAPVTCLFGPLSTLNLFLWLSFPLSAMSAFLVTRRLVHSNAAALVAGTFYGFSPYMVGHSLGQLNLLFVPLPPVIFYLLFRIVVVQRSRSWTAGILTGLAVSAQFLIYNEIAVTTLMVAAIGIVVLAVVQRADVTRERVRYVGVAAACALGVSVVLLAYPVALEFFGRQHPIAPLHGTLTADPYVADALSSIIPTACSCSCRER